MTEKYKDYTISVIQDDYPLNPREEFDNLGTMVCFHNRYSLGDKGHGYNRHDYDNWDELERQIIKDNGGCVTLPIYLYDHSGITINTTGFSCPWDSGRVGIIYVPRISLRSEYGWKKITKARKAKVEEYLRAEVETYDQYLRGEIYGYKVTDSNGTEIDSCGGYYGNNHEQSGLLKDARNVVDCERVGRYQAHARKVKE